MATFFRGRRTAAVATATAVVALIGGASYSALSQHEPTRVAGPKADQRAITPTGFAVTPAGGQTTIGNLPLNAALHPGGRHLLVTNNGQATQSVQLIDTTTSQVVQTLGYETPESTYVGLAWSPDGRTAYASASANSKVRVYSFDGSRLTEKDPIKLPTAAPDGTKVQLFPAGLAVTRDGSKLLVAGQLGNSLTSVDLASRKSVTAAIGYRPVWVTLSSNSRTAYVSDQGANTLDIVDVSGATPVVKGRIKVGLHPNKSILSPDGSRLYVANGDADTVSVVDVGRNKVVRTLRVGGTSTVDPKLIGANPTGLALDDRGRLYVTESGTNDVAVVALTSGKVLGRIPTAWYPSSVTYHDNKLFVTNAKGYGAGPNDGPNHMNPESTTEAAPDQYIAGMIKGTLSTVPVPSTRTLVAYSKRVAHNNAPVRTPGTAVVPAKPGDATPIKHVIYVVKENRTYDQVMGSLGKGNGDPSLTLFGDDVAPNSRALARRFVTLDNFYADAEVSANGWNWVTQANSNPYVEQMWPAGYSDRSGGITRHRSDLRELDAGPSRSYLWQRLDAAGIPFKNFGFYVQRKGDSFIGTDAILNRNTDHDFMAYDLDCPDSAGTFRPVGKKCLTPRVDQWLMSLATYEKQGKMPTVQMVRLGTDHTSGTTPGKPTPKAMVADNDLALGRLVEGVSHSSFWRDTVILATEDDAQDGPDHVDAHRTLAWAISPYTQTGKVDSTFYSTSSMVRTLGLIAGMGPLTQFDAYATPMNRAFTPTPNPAPYTAIRPTTNMLAVNGAHAPMAAASAAQRLSVADQVDEKTFNEAIWKSVKGSKATMPAPRHALLGDTAQAQRRAQAAAAANGRTTVEDADD